MAWKGTESFVLVGRANCVSNGMFAESGKLHRLAYWLRKRRPMLQETMERSEIHVNIENVINSLMKPQLTR